MPTSIRAAVVSSVAVALLVTGCPADDDAAGCDFDPAEWTELDPNDDSEGARRSQLAGTVIGCGLVDGATRADVAELLGPGQRPDSPTWEYSIRRTMIDYELLVVDFGPDDTVTSVSLGQS